MWVQEGGIGIPCFYEVSVKERVKGLGKELRENLEQLVPTTDNTV